MWKLNCGCGPVQEPFEFIIESTSTLYTNINNVILPNETNRDNCLIEKIIYDFFNVIDKLECGIQPDLENILQEISLIDMKNNWNFGITKEVYNSSPDDEEYLRKDNYLSEFSSEEGRQRVLDNLNLNIDKVKHVMLSKREFDALTEHEENTIYFVT